MLVNLGNFPLEKLPLEVLEKIASYHEIDNTIVRLSKTINDVFSNSVKEVKKITDVFSNLQSFFIYKKHCFGKSPFNFSQRILIGNFCENELKILAFEKNEYPNFDVIIKADLDEIKETVDPDANKNTSWLNYYVIPVTANLVHIYEAPIKKIQVTSKDGFSWKKHFIIEKAEKYANIFYRKPSPPNEYFWHSFASAMEDYGGIG